MFFLTVDRENTASPIDMKDIKKYKNGRAKITNKLPIIHKTKLILSIEPILLRNERIACAIYVLGLSRLTEFIFTPHFNKIILHSYL